MLITVIQEPFASALDGALTTAMMPNDAFVVFVNFRIHFETVKTSRLHWKWMKTEEKVRRVGTAADSGSSSSDRTRTEILRGFVSAVL